MRQRSQTPERLVLIIAAVASIAYIGGGIALLIYPNSFGFLPEPGPLRYSMAILLIVYGAFRAFRAYQRFREDF